MGVVDGVGRYRVAAYRTEGTDSREGVRARYTDNAKCTAWGSGRGADGIFETDHGTNIRKYSLNLRANPLII